MEAPSSILIRAKEGGFILGFVVGGRGGWRMEVSQPLFADYTFILCDASKKKRKYLSWTFIWFEAILGLKVNLEKIN